MWFELLILIIGIAFGFFHKGKEDLWGLLKMGAIIGIVLGIIFTLIAFLFAPGTLSLGVGLLRRHRHFYRDHHPRHHLHHWCLHW